MLRRVFRQVERPSRCGTGGNHPSTETRRVAIMPYITQTQREVLRMGMVIPKNAGELNYRFTRLALDYLAMNGTSYQHLNDIIGALEACKMEFYRRLVAVYEDGKILTNGDVYGEGG